MRTQAEILENLTEEQKEAVIHYTGKNVINASPGAGKTLSVVARAEYMIADGIPARQILLFTFTKKAADEMKERLTKRIGDLAKTMTICTYHSFCARFLRQYAGVLGRDRNFTIYDETDKKLVLQKLLKDNKNTDISKLMGYISGQKENYQNPDQAARTAQTGEFATYAIYYREYNNELKARNAFDFDDLLFYGYKLILEHPDTLQEINDRYPYVVADESHDSSVQDMKFIMLLTSVHHNLTLVADTDQSIYGFRGADVDNFARIILTQGFTIYNLTRNFRSTQTVVNAAQDVILNNNSPVQKKTYSKNAAGNPIYVYSCQDATNEAAMVTKICLFMHKKQGVAYKDMAVLSRLNYQSRPVEDSFLANGIPYQMAGISFYGRQEIRDIVSYLRIAVNEHDIEAFERSIQVPKRGIGTVSVAKLEENFFAANQKHDTMYSIESFCDSYRSQLRGPANAGLTSYWQTIHDLREKIAQGLYPEDVMDWLFRTLDFEAHLRKTCKDDEEFQDRVENIRELKRIAAAYQTFDEFTETIFMNAEIEQQDTKDAVSILTMHAAKGLEWKVVIIVGANEGVCPHKRSLQDPAQVQEERRLFYVAMTRAKEFLFILRARQAYGHGCMNFFKPSRFLDEIEDKYLVQQEV